MKIVFATPEKDWGGFLGLIRAELPEHYFEATGRFGLDTLNSPFLASGVVGRWK